MSEYPPGHVNTMFNFQQMQMGDPIMPNNVSFPQQGNCFTPCLDSPGAGFSPMSESSRSGFSPMSDSSQGGFSPLPGPGPDCGGDPASPAMSHISSVPPSPTSQGPPSPRDLPGKIPHHLAISLNLIQFFTRREEAFSLQT